MRTWRMAPLALMAAAALGIAGVMSTSGAIRAQDASGTPTTAATHPNHIHAGTCAALGDVIFPLTDLVEGDSMGTPMAMTDSADMAASPMAGMENAVAIATTTVAAPLADIIAGGHAINLHESVENIQIYIACGDITGTPTDNVLEIQLAEDNASGYDGKAELTDNGDGTTLVVVWLYEVDTMGTPTA